MVEIRRLTLPAELREVVDVQLSAWGMRVESCEAVPVHMLRALSENGGLILGAFDEGRLIGFSLGWYVVTGEGTYFYSHMTGVVEDRKYSGVGRALKLAQRNEVLSNGVRLIRWTFDPLQSLNSNFNLGRLGAVFTKYKESYYGSINDSINSGLETDRAIAEWYLDSRNVVMKLEGALRVPPAERLIAMGAAVAVKPNGPRGDERPEGPSLEEEPEVVLVGLPYSISDIAKRDPRRASEWRQATRLAYRRYLEAGYVASDFTWDSQGHGYVVMVREPLADVLDGVRPWS